MDLVHQRLGHLVNSVYLEEDGDHYTLQFDPSKDNDQPMEDFYHIMKSWRQNQKGMINDLILKYCHKGGDNGMILQDMLQV